MQGSPPVYLFWQNSSQKNCAVDTVTHLQAARERCWTTDFIAKNFFWRHIFLTISCRKKHMDPCARRSLTGYKSCPQGGWRASWPRTSTVSCWIGGTKYPLVQPYKEKAKKNWKFKKTIPYTPPFFGLSQGPGSRTRSKYWGGQLWGTRQKNPSRGPADPYFPYISGLATGQGSHYVN